MKKAVRLMVQFPRIGNLPKVRPEANLSLEAVARHGAATAEGTVESALPCRPRSPSPLAKEYSSPVVDVALHLRGSERGVQFRFVDLMWRGVPVDRLAFLAGEEARVVANRVAVMFF